MNQQIQNETKFMLFEQLTAVLPTLREPSDIKSTKKLSVSADSRNITIDLNNSNWVAIFDESGFPIVVDDSGFDQIHVLLHKGNYTAYSDGEIKETKQEEPNAFVDPFIGRELLVETDAPDVHVIDGIGEIPADGKSHCTISLTLIDQEEREVDDDLDVFLRTTGGTLKSSATDEKAIRQLKLNKGKGTFVMVADETPRVITVSILAEGLGTRNLELEFVPV